MPATCTYWDMRIVDFTLSKREAVAGGEVVASGRFLRWALIGGWGPEAHSIKIKLSYDDIDKAEYAEGRSNDDGYFEIPFTAPFVFETTDIDVYASSYDIFGDLDCGPLPLKVYSMEPVPPPAPPTPSVEKALLYGSLGLIGAGLLWTLTHRR